MSESKVISRRKWLKVAVAGSVVLRGANREPSAVSIDVHIESKPAKKVQIGLVADVHQDIIHDGFARMQTFADEMNNRKPNAVLQLGDFALPRKRNHLFLDTWNKIMAPRYHVLGNHDMVDLGFTREQTMRWWGMPNRYYSFDIGGWHFVVLDGNDQNPKPWNGYVRFVNREQRDWLAKDLAATDAPTMVFSHQQLESDSGVANSGEVRSILEAANQASGRTKVYACLCGHHHTDKLTDIAGIKYIHVNSMSYKWVGSKNQIQRFPDHIERTYPNLRNTAPYRDPLFTVLSLDPENGTMSLEGKATKFIPPTPTDLEIKNANEMNPVISSRTLKVLNVQNESTR